MKPAGVPRDWGPDGIAEGGTPEYEVGIPRGLSGGCDKCWARRVPGRKEPGLGRVEAWLGPPGIIGGR